jgi:hypothetical protein
MAANPRIVTEDRWITWDGVTQRLPKGQQIDVLPGSPLERAIGREYLVPLPGSAPAAEEAAAEEKPEPAPAKPRATAKAGSDSKDGGQ